ncbi:MAG: Rrf2 family transcriptional regulator [Candidatus Schekmanbacteria bacterium]|nr:Rrf2 family transcriptional regulator [Candidatus Schekmanbacteria bacterium]
MISKKAKYALKALVYMAKEYQKGPILISKVATEEKIPKKFLELILLTLKNNGILQSKKGKGGGYYLGRPPESITVGRVVRILDGPLALVPCVSETAYAKCDECIDERTCGIRLVMKDVRDSIAHILDSTSIADMLEKIKKLEPKEEPSLEYNI